MGQNPVNQLDGNLGVRMKQANYQANFSALTDDVCTIDRLLWEERYQEMAYE
jgi:hypothetical protein